MGLSLVLSGQEAEGMAMLREVATEPEATATASRNLEMAAQIAIENREAAANNVAEIDAKAQTEAVTPTALAPAAAAPQSEPAAKSEPRDLPKRAPSIATRSPAPQTAAAETSPQVSPASSMDQEIAASYATPGTGPAADVQTPTVQSAEPSETAGERPSFSRSAWRESMDAEMPETASKPAGSTAPRLTQSTPPRLGSGEPREDLPMSLAAAPSESEPAAGAETDGPTQTAGLKIVKAPESGQDCAPAGGEPDGQGRGRRPTASMPSSSALTATPRAPGAAGTSSRSLPRVCFRRSMA